MVENTLTVAWMTEKPAPEELLLLISCHCPTGCSSWHYSCISSRLLCTDSCKCENCEKQDAVDGLMPNPVHSAGEEDEDNAEVAAAESSLTNEVELD